MEPTRRKLLLAIGATGVLGGCLGDDSDDDGDDNPMMDDDEDATVRVAPVDQFGDVLVGPDGHTLYMFDVDEQGAGESACHDECLDNWPPLLVDDEPVAGTGVTAELTTFERESGETQVAANGWPLYYWIGDSGPGDTEGQAVNDVWWVLGPDGAEIREEPSDDDSAMGGRGY